MSSRSKTPKETYPLKAVEAVDWAVPETRSDDNKDGAAPLLSTQAPSLGFIYPPTSQPSAASNPYDIQPAYNPNFKSIKNGVVDQADEDVDQIRSDDTLEENDTAPDSSSKGDSCPQCCGITIVVLLIIVVLAVVIYFAVKHPQIARVVHSVITESKKSHEDGKSLAKVLLPGVTGGIKKIVNNSLTTTIKPLQNNVDDDDPWSDDDDLIPVFYT